MLGDPGRSARAAGRRAVLSDALPPSIWKSALIGELEELHDHARALEARLTGGPRPTSRAMRAADDIADGLVQRPEQAMHVALRILARLDTVPTADQIAAVRADLYGGERGANGQPAG